MSNENKESVEQMTTPPASVVKIKDPKKIAAGKKLAEYNKKAKAKQKNIAMQNYSEFKKKEDENVSNNFLPETSFTTIIAFLGLGLTAIDLFLRYKSSKLSHDSYKIDPQSELIDSKKVMQSSQNEEKLIGME